MSVSDNDEVDSSPESYELRATIVNDAMTIIELAAAKGVVIRLIGGVAIYHRSGDRGRQVLGRMYEDFDLVGRRKQSRDLRALLEQQGYKGETIFNATHGESRLLYIHPEGKYHIDIFFDEFVMSHKLNLGQRLSVDSVAMPAADLLLTKMQVAEINQKDLTDSAMLLLDHSPATSDGERDLNVNYIAEILGSDWGLYTTVTDNLNRLDQALSLMPLSEQEQELIRTRVRGILSHVEKSPKTSRWKMRARVGRRVVWYLVPEEIGG